MPPSSLRAPALLATLPSEVYRAPHRGPPLDGRPQVAPSKQQSTTAKAKSPIDLTQSPAEPDMPKPPAYALPSPTTAPPPPRERGSKRTPEEKAALQKCRDATAEKRERAEKERKRRPRASDAAVREEGEGGGGGDGKRKQASAAPAGRSVDGSTDTAAGGGFGASKVDPSASTSSAAPAPSPPLALTSELANAGGLLSNFLPSTASASTDGFDWVEDSIMAELASLFDHDEDQAAPGSRQGSGALSLGGDINPTSNMVPQEQPQPASRASSSISAPTSNPATLSSPLPAAPGATPSTSSSLPSGLDGPESKRPTPSPLPPFATGPAAGALPLALPAAALLPGPHSPPAAVGGLAGASTLSRPPHSRDFRRYYGVLRVFLRVADDISC
ncbi:hypothetical protein JCM8208_005576 [Rhodotorula glutinis]